MNNLLVRMIAQSPDPSDALQAVDYYCQQAEKAGARLAVQPQYMHLLSVIEEYIGDLRGLRLFFRAVRDQTAEIHGEQSQQYIDCQEQVRVLDVRSAQQRRRARSQAALKWAKQRWPKMTAPERQVWLRKLEKAWAGERLERLREASAKSRRGKITPAEKAEIVEQFWEDLDDRIKNGVLPGVDE